MVAPIVAAGLLSAGGSILGGLFGSNAAKKAANAQADATRASLAQQQQQYDQTRADYEPFRQIGLQGLNAVAGAYGIGPNGQGGTNWAQYVQSNPDVLANWQAVQADPNNPFGGDIARFGQFQYNQASQAAQAAGAPPPDITPFSTGGQQAPLTTQAVQGPTGSYTVNTGQDGSVTGTRPAYQAPQDYTRPAITEAPQYTRQEFAPLDVSLGAFQDSGEYAAQMQATNEAARAGTAAASALGGLRSGATLLELDRRAQANALQGFGQFANRTTNQYNVDRSRADANFNADRSYGTSLWERLNTLNQGNFESDRAYGTGLNQFQNTFAQDLYNQDRNFAAGQGQQRMSNLFNLAGVGQNATGAVTNAGQNFTNNFTNLTTQQGDNRANYYGAQSNLFSNALNGAIGGVYQAYRGGLFGGGVPGGSLGGVPYYLGS